MPRIVLALFTLGLVAATAAPASAAAPQRTVRLLSPGQASTHAFLDGMSADGSRTVFTTTEALVGTDVNGTADLYARDADGTLQLISSGATAAAPTFGGVSATGDRTWYTTSRGDVPADTDAGVDVYERRRDGTLRQISLGIGAFDAAFVQGSATGDHVVFSTEEAVLPAVDGDTVRDLYDRRADGSLALLTPGTAVTMAAFANRNALSADGTRVSFSTTESLDDADGDALLDTYSVPTAGGAPVLLTPGTFSAPTFALLNRAGTIAWFVTANALVTADADTADDVYERRADGTLLLVSGGTENTNATLVGGLDDGSSVVFRTQENLLPADGDTTGFDLYERRADDSLHLVSGGTADALSAEFMGENADGSIVFQSPESLLPADTDIADSGDVYLRRPDGELVLLTPDTPASISILYPSPAVPSTLARTVFAATDLPATGDVNGVADAYEATADGARLLATGVPAGTDYTFSQAADGSRIAFLTTSPIAGTGDSDGAQDVYEADFALPAFAAAPGLSGTAKVGSILTCAAPAATGEETTTSIAWLRDSTVIKGATAATYRIALADAGHVVRCRVTARNPIGSTVALSAGRGIAPVAAATRLAGFPIVGLKLTCTTFSGAQTTKYAWKRGTKTVKGRTGRTYKVARTDLGRRLTCTATGRAGALASTASLRITVPRACVVPAVRGLTPAAAKNRLGNAGCRTRSLTVSGSGVKKGLALGTSPGRGAKRANGARITIRFRR